MTNSVLAVCAAAKAAGADELVVADSHGDDVFVAETSGLLGDVAGAVLKSACGTTSAISPGPAVALA